MAKCTFQKFGPSGSLQKHDALCVLPLNIINEKVNSFSLSSLKHKKMNPFQIYVFLYLWFVFLAAVSGIWLVYRILTIFSHQVGLGTVLFFTPILSRNLAKNKWYAPAEYQKYDVKDRHYVHVSHAPNDCRWEWTWSTQEQIAKWTRTWSMLVSPRMTTGSSHNCNVFHYYVCWEVFVSTIVNQPWPKSLSWSPNNSLRQRCNI